MIRSAQIKHDVLKLIPKVAIYLDSRDDILMSQLPPDPILTLHRRKKEPLKIDFQNDFVLYKNAVVAFLKESRGGNNLHQFAKFADKLIHTSKKRLAFSN